MAIGKRVWRPVPVDSWEWLQDVSPLAQRLWLWLWTGPASTATGLISLREYQAVGALRTKPAALRDALTELELEGRVTVQLVHNGRRDLYLTHYLIEQCGVKDVQRLAIKRSIDAFADGSARAQAIEDWAVWDSACAQAERRQASGRREPKPQQEQEQEQEFVLPTGVGSSAREAHANGKNRQTNGNGPRTDDLFADDSQPAKAQKRQPRGQDGAKTAKPRSLAQQPPTLDETRAIFAEHNAPASEAQRCLDYWTSAGFRRKAGPIKDWPATCRTWINNWRDSGHSYGSRKAQAPLMVFDQADLERQMAEQEREMREAEARGESWF